MLDRDVREVLAVLDGPQPRKYVVYFYKACLAVCFLLALLLTCCALYLIALQLYHAFRDLLTTVSFSTYVITIRGWMAAFFLLILAHIIVAVIQTLNVKVCEERTRGLYC